MPSKKHEITSCSSKTLCVLRILCAKKFVSSVAKNTAGFSRKIHVRTIHELSVSLSSLNEERAGVRSPRDSGKNSSAFDVLEVSFSAFRVPNSAFKKIYVGLHPSCCAHKFAEVQSNIHSTLNKKI